MLADARVGEPIRRGAGRRGHDSGVERRRQSGRSWAHGGFDQPRWRERPPFARPVTEIGQMMQPRVDYAALEDQYTAGVSQATNHHSARRGCPCLGRPGPGYIDCVSHGVANLGHCHPDGAGHQDQSRALLTCQRSSTTTSALLLERLASDASGLDTPSSATRAPRPSGGHQVRRVTTGRTGIVATMRSSTGARWAA